MTTKLNCAIIGAGIAGASAAYALAQRGADVTLFEQFDFSHDRGSSHGPTRLFRLAYFERPEYVPLLQRCVSLWRDLERNASDTFFHKTGVFMLGAPNGALLTGVRRASSNCSVPIEQLSRTEAAKRFPWFSQPDGYEAVFEPDAGFLRADTIVRHLLAKTTALGGATRPRTQILDWACTTKGVDVITKNGRETFDRLIIAPGAWGNELLKINAPIQPMRKALFWIAPNEAAYHVKNGFTPFAIDREDGRFFYGFPAIDSHGIKVGEHTGGAPLKDALDPAPPLASEGAGIQESLQDILPNAPRDFTTEKHCLYEMSPDGDFVIDTHPTDTRVCFAAGLSGHGFKFGPVIGEALADFAIDGATTKDFDFLGLDRFGA